MREMILADDERAGARRRKILPMQRDDFAGSSAIMDGLPVTIRLLDPPLHEFLPHERSTRSPRSRRRPGSSSSAGQAPRRRAARGQPDARPPRLPARHHLPRDLRDAGARDLRGRAATSRGRAATRRARGDDPAGRAPRASSSCIKALIDAVAAKVFAARSGRDARYLVGTMIELPRAALRRRRDRRARGVLLVRHQRPHPDDARPIARRCRRVPRRLLEQGIFARRPVPASTRRAWASSSASASSAAARPARPEARHLRRAWRRPGLDRSATSRPRLRLLLALPRADRAPRGRPGGPERPAHRAGSLGRVSLTALAAWIAAARLHGRCSSARRRARDNEESCVGREEGPEAGRRGGVEHEPGRDPRSRGQETDQRHEDQEPRGQGVERRDRNTSSRATTLAPRRHITPKR